TNSLRQRSTDPKSRVRARASASVGRPSPNAMLAKYSSWSRVELSAISSSRFRLLAFDEPQRQAVEQPRTSVDRGQLVLHVHSFTRNVGNLAADDEIVEGGDGIGLGPEADPPGCESRIPGIEMESAVVPRLDAVAHRDHPDGVPLAERRRPHAGRRELPAAALV